MVLRSPLVPLAGADSGRALADSIRILTAQQFAYLTGIYSVREYGALGDGVTDDTQAFIRAIAAARAAGGGIVYVPPGTYLISSTLEFNQTQTVYSAATTVSLVGAGSHCTTLKLAHSSGFALDFYSTDWTKAHARWRIEGLKIDGQNYTRSGLRARKARFIALNDVLFYQCGQSAEFYDVVGAHFDRTNVDFNNYGFIFDWGADYPPTGSAVNEVVFTDCHVTNNRQHGFWFKRGSTNIVFIGGSMEGNGFTSGSYSSDANRWCIRIAGGAQFGAFAFSIFGTHFESNGGKCEIWIEHGDYRGTYSLFGADFFRNGNYSQQTTNHIFAESTGSAHAAIVCRGVGFGSYPSGTYGYTGSASTKVVAYDATKFDLFLEECEFNEPAEIPVTSARGKPNLICNGDGRIRTVMATSQINNASTPTVNNDRVQIADNVFLLSDGNDAVNIDMSTSTRPDGALSSLKATVVTADKKFGFAFPLRLLDALTLQGETVSAAFAIKTTSAKLINAVRASILSWTSTGDAMTDPVSSWGSAGTNPTWASNWTAENAGYDIPVTTSWVHQALGQVVLDTAAIQNLVLFIWVDESTSVGDEIFISQVRLTQGNVPGKNTPRAFSEEKRRCGAFLRSSYNVDVKVGTVTGAGAVQHRATATVFQVEINADWESPMRATPTTTWYSTNSGTAANLYDSTAAADVAVASTNGAGMQCSGYPQLSGAATANNFLLGQYLSDASLSFV